MTCEVKGEFKDAKFQIDCCENSRLIFKSYFSQFTNLKNLNTSMLIITFCNQNVWSTLKINIHLDSKLLIMIIVVNMMDVFEKYLLLQNAIQTPLQDDLAPMERVHKNCPFNYCSFSRKGISPAFADSQYDNNHAQKTWLQYIFPFYIWFLVGVIILFCHYSSTVMKLMGMRNIEVLATLSLLSYAKLLKTNGASANDESDPLILKGCECTQNIYLWF